MYIMYMHVYTYRIIAEEYFAVWLNSVQKQSFTEFPRSSVSYVKCMRSMQFIFWGDKIFMVNAANPAKNYTVHDCRVVYHGRVM